jgi:hypothetical protein
MVQGNLLALTAAHFLSLATFQNLLIASFHVSPSPSPFRIPG